MHPYFITCIPHSSRMNYAEYFPDDKGDAKKRNEIHTEPGFA